MRMKGYATIAASRHGNRKSDKFLGFGVESTVGHSRFMHGTKTGHGAGRHFGQGPHLVLKMRKLIGIRSGGRQSC